MTETHENNFLFNTWYFIGTSSDINLRKMVLCNKKEWNNCNELGRKFKNPVKATTLKWRT